MRYSANKSTLSEMKPSSFGYKHWFYNASIYIAQENIPTLRGIYHPILADIQGFSTHQLSNLCCLFGCGSQRNAFVIVAPITFAAPQVMRYTPLSTAFLSKLHYTSYLK